MQLKEGLWQTLNTPLYAREMIHKIKEIAPREVKLLEVCGTHTMSISRFGLRRIFAGSLDLISGPGCPVCVTDVGDIDAAVALCRQDNVTVATFGDMMRVPGSESNLGEEKSRGRDVRVVYSPYDAVAMARSNPSRQVVFLAIGFETTIPGILLALREAIDEQVENFSLLVLFKTTPPAVRELLQSQEAHFDGILLPGHVSAIIGREAWDFVARDFLVPAVVTGFMLMDILSGIYQVEKMSRKGQALVLNDYKRAVVERGNPKALHLMEKYLEVFPARWRGIGKIGKSGLRLKEEFAVYDAAKRFAISLPRAVSHRGCMCGSILMGQGKPFDCPLFATECTPMKAVGPCMVSSEGACAAYYQYERQGGSL